jgi:hypothetical protein
MHVPGFNLDSIKLKAEQKELIERKAHHHYTSFILLQMHLNWSLPLFTPKATNL